MTSEQFTSGGAGSAQSSGPTQCSRCGNLNPPDSRACARCGITLGSEFPPESFRLQVQQGTVLDGRYRIEAFIGAGAAAQVFAAVDQRLDRRVALKILSAEMLGSRRARQRMEQEAAALARIRHPNVIEINNMFDHAGTLVLDLELVTGGTLATSIPPGGMPCSQALSLLSAVLSGLEEIHAQGLVHRDIKPANVLLTEKGVPKIADLGIALDNYSSFRTKTGARLGTPTYMSPEQIRGIELDARADIYACGIVLYELLSGDLPFNADSEFDVMSKHVHELPDLSSLSKLAPPSVVEVIRKALEKEPSARWQHAAQMREALQPPAAEPVSAPPERDSDSEPVQMPVSDGSRTLRKVVLVALPVILGIACIAEGVEISNRDTRIRLLQSELSSTESDYRMNRSSLDAAKSKIDLKETEAKNLTEKVEALTKANEELSSVTYGKSTSSLSWSLSGRDVNWSIGVKNLTKNTIKVKALALCLYPKGIKPVPGYGGLVLGDSLSTITGTIHLDSECFMPSTQNYYGVIAYAEADSKTQVLQYNIH